VRYANISYQGTRIAFATFSTMPAIHFKLGTLNTLSEVQNAIQNTRFVPGERNMAGGFDDIRRNIFFEEYGDRPEVPDVLLLLTTGKSNWNEGITLQHADAIKSLGVHTIGLSVGVTDLTELKSIVTSPWMENLFDEKTADGLKVISELIYGRMCASEFYLALILAVYFNFIVRLWEIVLGTWGHVGMEDA